MVDAVVNEGLQVLGIPSYIRMFFIDDEGRKPKNSVSDLLPKTQWRLRINHPDSNSMQI